jgi:SagB-type dehydrogenase family enzyme
MQVAYQRAAPGVNNAADGRPPLSGYTRGRSSIRVASDRMKGNEMKGVTSKRFLAGGAAVLLILVFCSKGKPEPPAATAGPAAVKLPDHREDGGFSLEKALAERRSTRKFGKRALSLAETGQLLWAAQGVTNSAGFRTAPSAGALFPLEVYVVAGRVKGLAAGVYRYRPHQHELLRVAGGDRRRDLHDVALHQDPVTEAPLTIVITAVYERTRAKYGERGDRYADIEVGHAAQNVCLQAASLGLGAVTIGAFDDGGVREVIGGSARERPRYLLPVGAP